ncbi:beta strand repeat-containing protein [Methylocucumis oryzae]|uniref:beta strand repeat-containing protein n=1 Tax=Methylocucumis oryzae TaxID=1632867 RepID=UPI0006983F47|nr:FG-GAP-like repeat-containing protein [Methylocucumis oryzae]
MSSTTLNILAGLAGVLMSSTAPNILANESTDSVALAKNKAVIKNINLSTLSSSKAGFKITGTESSYTGSAVSYGDLNGDGFSDMIISAPGDAYGIKKGAVYVLYGKGGAFTDTAVTKANAQFTSNSSVNTGKSVSAGDINGDGIADLVVGATGSIFGSSDGEVFVVFGKTGGIGTLNLSSSAIKPSDGIRLSGGDTKILGYSVSSAGDFNGDGIDDLVIGAIAPYSKPAPGVAYIVFGGHDISSLDLGTLNGENGFKFSSLTSGDSLGGSVSSAGDINGDGYDDVIIGAPFADTSGTNSGASYVLFGKASGFDDLTTADLNGRNGFVVSGATDNNFSGFPVSGAGDFNGDGYSDLLITAPYADSVYVLFGKATGFSASLNVSSLTGKNGFKISGASFSKLGDSASNAGDVNGDGFDDILIGQTSDTGNAYVVFGKASGFSDLSISALNGQNGFKLTGVNDGDNTGGAVSSAGDLNGDGFDDLIVGASGVNNETGAAYVIQGKNFTNAVDFLGTTGVDKLTGTPIADVFVSGLGNDVLIGKGGADVIHAGKGQDIIQVSTLNFRLVDGGSGNDSLVLTGKNQTLNLADKHGRIKDIETINLTGSGNNTLVLTANAVLNLSSTSNTLKVLGNKGDSVTGISSAKGWVRGTNQGDFQYFYHGNAVVLVGLNVTVNFV